MKEVTDHPEVGNYFRRFSMTSSHVHDTWPDALGREWPPLPSPPWWLVLSLCFRRLDQCQGSPTASLPLPWRAEGSKAKTRRSPPLLLLLLHRSRWRNGEARPPQSSIEPLSSPLTPPLSPLKGFNFKVSNPSFYSIISLLISSALPFSLIREREPLFQVRKSMAPFLEEDSWGLCSGGKY